MILTWEPKATNIEILMHIKKIIYPELDDQIKLHMVQPRNGRTIPLGRLNLKDYKNLLFVPTESTYKTFKQKVEIQSLYSGRLLNFLGWDQLTKITLNEIWTKANIDVPRSIRVNKQMDLDVIPDTIFPAVMFEYIGHADAGKHTLVHNKTDIDTWFATYPNKNKVMLQKFIDFKKEDGYYYKCRVIKIGDRLLPIYTHRSKKWLWHIDPCKRDLAPYEIVDFDLSWFEDRIGLENFWTGINNICEPIKADNYAIDICLNKNENVVPFEITVPYARNIVHVDNEEIFEGDFKCGINHWIAFLKWIGTDFDEKDFTEKVRTYVIAHGNMKADFDYQV